MRRVASLVWALALAGCQSEAPPAPSTPAPPPDAARPAPDAAKKPAALPPGALPPPTDAQIVALEHAKTAAERGDAKAALAAYLRAAAGPPSGLSVSARLAAADLLQTDNKDADAARLYEGLLRDAPRLPEVQFAAARFFATQSDTARAIESFRAALAGQPDLLPAYPLLGALLSQEKRGDEAATLMAQYEIRLNRLLRRVRDPRQPPPDRLDIIELLGVLDDERASDALRALLKDGVPELRTTAGAFLADEPSPENLVALSEAAVAEKNPVARRVLTAALKRARDAALSAPTPPSMPAPQGVTP